MVRSFVFDEISKIVSKGQSVIAASQVTDTIKKVDIYKNEIYDIILMKLLPNMGHTFASLTCKMYVYIPM